MPKVSPLPPMLEAYYQKIRSQDRLKQRKAMTQQAWVRLFSMVQIRYRQALASASINPQFDDVGSNATGQLSNSLRKTIKETATTGDVTIWTSARHFEFVDTGEYKGDNPVSPERIRIWVEAKFGIPRATDPSTPVQLSDSERPRPYGTLIGLITNIVRERLQAGYYRGLELTKLIGDTISLGRGQSTLFRLFDQYRSLYTFGPVT